MTVLFSLAAHARATMPRRAPLSRDVSCFLASPSPAPALCVCRRPRRPPSAARMAASETQGVHSDGAQLRRAHSLHNAKLQEGEPMRRYVVDPEASWRQLLDVTLVLMLIYVGVVTPFRLSFSVWVDPWSTWFWTEVVVDLLFVLDLVLNFFTAYPDEHSRVLVTDLPTIRRKYLRGWFTIDLVAVLPFAYVEVLSQKSNGQGMWSVLGEQRVMKVLRLMRLAKLLRLPKFIPMIRRLDERFDGLLTSCKMVTLILIVLYVTHIVGCLWYYIGTHNDTEYCLQETNDTDEEETTCIVLGWVARENWGPSAGTFTKYLRSFYFAITTLTTIGYGDVTASTNAEMGFAVFAELVGTMVFGVLIGSVGTMIGRRKMLEDRHEAEMAEVKEFMASKRIPSELQRKVRVHLGNLFNHRRAFDESQLLRHLPPQLMFEMLHEVYIESVWQVPVFKGLDEEIMAEICFILLPVSRPQGTVLFDVGDVARETYVVMEGSVQLSNVGAHAIHHGHDLSNQTPLDTVKAGDWVWRKRPQPVGRSPCRVLEGGTKCEVQLELYGEEATEKVAAADAPLRPTSGIGCRGCRSTDKKPKRTPFSKVGAEKAAAAAAAATLDMDRHTARIHRCDVRECYEMQWIDGRGETVAHHNSIFGEEVLDFKDGVTIQRMSRALVTSANGCNMSLLRASELEQLAKTYPKLAGHMLDYRENRERRTRSGTPISSPRNHGDNGGDDGGNTLTIDVGGSDGGSDSKGEDEAGQTGTAEGEMAAALRQLTSVVQRLDSRLASVEATQLQLQSHLQQS